MAPEASLPDATVAVGSGYPESKWVAEQILDRASQRTSFTPVIVRIGQLSGGRNGYWNPSEWVPSVIQTGPALKCLPDTQGVSGAQPISLILRILTLDARRVFPGFRSMKLPKLLLKCALRHPLSYI